MGIKASHTHMHTHAHTYTLTLIHTLAYIHTHTNTHSSGVIRCHFPHDGTFQHHELVSFLTPVVADKVEQILDGEQQEN